MLNQDKERAKGGGGTPLFEVIFGHFGPKWPKTVNSRGPYWSARYCMVLNQSVPYPLGVTSEATKRVYFGRTASPVPKYTLLVASELTTHG